MIDKDILYKLAGRIKESSAVLEDTILDLGRNEIQLSDGELILLNELLGRVVILNEGLSDRRRREVYKIFD